MPYGSYNGYRGMTPAQAEQDSEMPKEKSKGRIQEMLTKLLAQQPDAHSDSGFAGLEGEQENV